MTTGNMTWHHATRVASEPTPKQQPLISVIVPVYNVLPYLQEALDSVIGQTYDNLEIIVVDDGSTDGSEEICDDYAASDSRVLVIHQENQGLSAARNAGIDLATGDYLLFLDSDDWMELDAVEVLAQAITTTDADVVCCQHFKELVGYAKKPHNAQGKTYSSEEALIALIRSKEISTTAWAKLYRTKAFTEIRYPTGRVYEDVATTWRVLDKASLVVSVPVTLYHYRRRKGSITDNPTMGDLIDYWNAHKDRLTALESRSEEVRRGLVEYCLDAIGRTWSWYLTCSKAERKMHATELNEMSKFARDYTLEVLHKQYSTRTKALCIACRRRNLLICAALLAANTLRRLPQSRRLYAY